MATYKRQQPASLTPTEYEIGWAVGFLEGEGCFSRMSGTDKRARMFAGQKQQEPLDLLLKIFGGRIYKLKTRQYYTWMLRGERARRWIVFLKPLFSSRRQAQIEAMLNGALFSVAHGSPERFQQKSDIRKTWTR